MSTNCATRSISVLAALAGYTLCPLSVPAVSIAAETAPVATSQSDAAASRSGFVFTHFAYALAADADKSGACPDGMTAGYHNMGDAFLGRSDLQRHEGEQEQAYLQRLFTQALRDPDTQNLCLNPELGKPDPNWRIVKNSNVEVDGINLSAPGSAGATASAMFHHEPFRGADGKRDVDNQFYRLVGCSKSFQSTGQSNTFEIVMYSGEWGILLTLDGASDLRNASNVEVGIYASADPLQLSATREALSNATYAIDQDPRFRATAHGRIVNGVLTTDPVDVRFHWIVNSIHLERPLNGARIRATVTADGNIEGILAGYTPVEAMYDLQYGFRNGKDANGKPAAMQLRSGSSVGQAFVLGHTCNGAYYELKALADGDCDAKTGCKSISTQYRFKAIPAFVVDAKTESINSGLDKAGFKGGYDNNSGTDKK